MLQYSWDEEETKFQADNREKLIEKVFLAMTYEPVQKKRLWNILDTLDSIEWRKRKGCFPTNQKLTRSNFKKLLYQYGIKQIREKRLYYKTKTNRNPSQELTVRAEFSDRIPRPKIEFSCPEAHIISDNILSVLEDGKKYSALDLVSSVCTEKRYIFSRWLVFYVLWRMVEGRLLDSVEER